jgi:two-component system heavy metal sensor histidine kinase CusS
VNTKALCGYSIGKRLSWQLAWQTVLGLGILCAGIWATTYMFVTRERNESMQVKVGLLQDLMRGSMARGGETETLNKLDHYAPRRPGTFLEIKRADGSMLWRDASEPGTAREHWRGTDFVVNLADGRTFYGHFAEDCSMDAKMLTGLALTLLGATFAGAAFVGIGTFWRVRRGLRPLIALARQTQAISPERLGERLHLREPVEELQPWIDQFNGLLGRLEQAYQQLEGFNADVAHELRTPLASLIGHTEVALSRERSAEVLRDTLVSNLEELNRLSAMINDMLFLSQSDRGAMARRGEKVSLAALAQQVVEFHEAPAEEAGLTVAIEGDVYAAVDEPLFKRAVSNLLGNALRFAQAGSRVVVRIAPDEAQQVRVEVQNAGPTIEPQHLSRLFDRFFRADSSRCCEGTEQHHGLGLAIVAAIARMHAGRPLAESGGGTTKVGFTLATG